MDTNFQSVIPATRRGKYRQHPLEFKRAVVALSLQPGASVARIAREHGVNANQVFSWRRLYHEGRLGDGALIRGDGLLPVVLAQTASAPDNGADGAIVLEIGAVRLRIEGKAEPTTLALVLERLLR